MVSSPRPDHPHVHFHIIPRAVDLPQDRRSLNVFSCLGGPEEHWIGEDEMNEIASKVRAIPEP